MNWVLIMVVLLIAWNVVRGYSHGILRMIYSLAAWIVMLVIVSWATPHVSAYLSTHTNIETNIQERCREQLGNIVENQGGQGSNAELLDAMGIKLPNVVVNELFGSNNLADSILESTGMYDTVSQKLSELAMTGISFVLVLLALMIISHLILQLIKVVEKLPVISGANRFLGAAGGLIKGIVLIWVIFAIVALNSTSGLGATIISYIYESKFLQIIYENNIILVILLSFL